MWVRVGLTAVFDPFLFAQFSAEQCDIYHTPNLTQHGLRSNRFNIRGSVVPSSVISFLTNSAMFGGIRDTLSEGLVARGTSVALVAGQSLFLEGDNAEGFYVVKSGGLKATRISADGGEQLLAVFSMGDAIGEMAIFDEAPRSATITALRPSTLIYWSKAGFFRFADEHPELYRLMLSMIARRLRDTNDALAARDFLPLAGQLAQVMLRLRKGFGEAMGDDTGRIAHKLTQAELAAMIGASRENVSRVLNEWKRKGLVSRTGGYYHLLDEEALEDLSVG